MSDDQISNDEPAPGSRRRMILWIVGAVVAVAVIGTAIAFAVAPRGTSAEPAPSGTAPTSSTPAAPTSSDSPTPGATEPVVTPSVAPTDESNPFPELPPVEPEEPGKAEGIQASLVKFEKVTGEVVGPGDVAAPAVRVTVEIKNTGTKPLDMNLVVVNAYMGAQRDPAETYEQPGGEPVSGSLAAGKTTSGVYLFRIPEDRRDDVTFVVDYHAGEPAIAFRGAVP